MSPRYRCWLLKIWITLCRRTLCRGCQKFRNYFIITMHSLKMISQWTSEKDWKFCSIRNHFQWQLPFIFPTSTVCREIIEIHLIFKGMDFKKMLTLSTLPMTNLELRVHNRRNQGCILEFQFGHIQSRS